MIYDLYDFFYSKKFFILNKEYLNLAEIYNEGYVQRSTKFKYSSLAPLELKSNQNKRKHL